VLCRDKTSQNSGSDTAFFLGPAGVKILSFCSNSTRVPYHQLIEVFFFQPFFQILENLWKKISFKKKLEKRAGSAM
jgi:hypothetical protein